MEESPLTLHVLVSARDKLGGAVRDLELADAIAEDERLAGELRVVADALVVEGWRWRRRW